MGLYELLVNVIVPLSTATAFGALIGWERETEDKPAGLRTHMMVSLGAASFTLIALRLYQDAVATAQMSRVDPIRIVEGIVTGIGFLGAGSIIRSRGEVHGITTAAGIWVVGAIGAACGTKSYDIAAISVAFAFVILGLLRRLEARKAQ